DIRPHPSIRDRQRLARSGDSAARRPRLHRGPARRHEAQDEPELSRSFKLFRVTRLDVYAVLDQLGIRYTKYEHDALHTCEAALAAIPDRSSIQTKNLFLRDKPGRRHFLLVTSCEKPVDIKKFATSIDAGHLSFGSAERLERHLGVT